MFRKERDSIATPNFYPKRRQWLHPSVHFAVTDLRKTGTLLTLSLLINRVAGEGDDLSTGISGNAQYAQPPA